MRYPLGKIASFGCSLTFGTELQDDDIDLPVPTASQLTWPALIAKHFGRDYRCCARGGAGNLNILQNILSVISGRRPEFGPFLWIVNWTFIDRFDMLKSTNDPPYTSWSTIRPNDTTAAGQMYYRELHTEIRDKLASLIHFKVAKDVLLQYNIPFVMTCVDDLAFDTKWNIDPVILMLQQELRPYIQDFEGRNFLDWSRHRGFEITEAGHPLEEAHAAAAELMLPKIKHILEFGVNKK